MAVLAGADVDLDDVRSSAEANLMGVALDTLAKRNYAVGAMIDGNGNFPGGSALSKDDLLATVGSLARYGATAAEHPGSLPWPFLPARLGTTTGADATLYVGGWGYVTKHREVTGEQVAKGIVIGLLIHRGRAHRDRRQQVFARSWSRRQRSRFRRRSRRRHGRRRRDACPHR
jgi:hypothetical protein